MSTVFVVPPVGPPRVETTLVEDPVATTTFEIAEPWASVVVTVSVVPPVGPPKVEITLVDEPETAMTSVTVEP